jgi:cyanophycin synthetase
VCGTGDRRDEDLREVGRIAGETFDKIVLRRGDHLRGRGEDNMRELLMEGIKETGKNVPVEYIAETPAAINRALDNSGKGDLVVILGDTVRTDIEVVNKYREKAVEDSIHITVT